MALLSALDMRFPALRTEEALERGADATLRVTPAQTTAGTASLAHTSSPERSMPEHVVPTPPPPLNRRCQAEARKKGHAGGRKPRRGRGRQAAASDAAERPLATRARKRNRELTLGSSLYGHAKCELSCAGAASAARARGANPDQRATARTCEHEARKHDTLKTAQVAEARARHHLLETLLFACCRAGTKAKTHVNTHVRQQGGGTIPICCPPWP